MALGAFNVFQNNLIFAFISAAPKKVLEMNEGLVQWNAFGIQFSKWM